MVPHDAARRGRRSPSGWPACWPPRATPPTCWSASRRACRMLGEDLTPLDVRGAHRPRWWPRPAARTIRATRSGRSGPIRRRELFRIAVGDLLGETDVADVGAGLSRLTDATLEATLEVAGRAVRRAARPRQRADPDGDRRDGPVRRLRAVLRQRRRRAVRARPAAGRRPAGGVDVRPGRRQRAAPAAARCPATTRRSRSTPTCGPRASRGRWCAPSTPTPPTTPSGRRCGRRRRCCAPTPWSATRTCGDGSPS